MSSSPSRGPELMSDDRSHEAAVIEAVRLLREARTVLNFAYGAAEHKTSGRRSRFILETLQSATKRISSTYRELEKLVPRQRDRSVLTFPPESFPQTVKWGGGPPPQWV